MSGPEECYSAHCGCCPEWEKSVFEKDAELARLRSELAAYRAAGPMDPDVKMALAWVDDPARNSQVNPGILGLARALRAAWKQLADVTRERDEAVKHRAAAYQAADNWRKLAEDQPELMRLAIKERDELRAQLEKMK